MIRWNITDRATGQELVVGHPTTDGERDQMKSIIKNFSKLGLSEQGKYQQQAKRRAA